MNYITGLIAFGIDKVIISGSPVVVMTAAPGTRGDGRRHSIFICSGSGTVKWAKLESR